MKGQKEKNLLLVGGGTSTEIQVPLRSRGNLRTGNTQNNGNWSVLLQRNLFGGLLDSHCILKSHLHVIKANCLCTFDCRNLVQLTINSTWLRSCCLLGPPVRPQMAADIVCPFCNWRNLFLCCFFQVCFFSDWSKKKKMFCTRMMYWSLHLYKLLVYHTMCV